MEGAGGTHHRLLSLCNSPPSLIPQKAPIVLHPCAPLIGWCNPPIPPWFAGPPPPRPRDQHRATWLRLRTRYFGSDWDVQLYTYDAFQFRETNLVRHHSGGGPNRFQAGHAPGQTPAWRPAQGGATAALVRPKLHKTWAGKTREHRALLAFAGEARLTPLEIRWLLSELMSAARFIGSGPDGTDTYRARAVAAINNYLK